MFGDQVEEWLLGYSSVNCHCRIVPVQRYKNIREGEGEMRSQNRLSGMSQPMLHQQERCSPVCVLEVRLRSAIGD